MGTRSVTKSGPQGNRDGATCCAILAPWRDCGDSGASSPGHFPGEGAKAAEAWVKRGVCVCQIPKEGSRGAESARRIGSLPPRSQLYPQGSGLTEESWGESKGGWEGGFGKGKRKRGGCV